MMRTVFFIGKGGVGKTTCALATALATARAGRRVTVASLDPAHSLGDLAGAPLDDAPRELEPGLRALEVDVDGRRRRAVESVVTAAEQARGHLVALGLDGMTRLLEHSPGLEEQAALEALAELAASAGDEHLVVDAPATALASRLLTLPALTASWLDRLLDLRTAILSKRASIARITREPAASAGRSDPVRSLIEEDRGTMRALASLLGSAATSYALVVNPDVLSVRESRRLVAALGAVGRRPSLWVLNRDRGGAEPAELSTLSESAPVLRRPESPQPIGTRDDLAAHGEPIRVALGW